MRNADPERANTDNNYTCTRADIPDQVGPILLMNHRRCISTDKLAQVIYENISCWLHRTIQLIYKKQFMQVELKRFFHRELDGTLIAKPRVPQAIGISNQQVTHAGPVTGQKGKR